MRRGDWKNTGTRENLKKYHGFLTFGYEMDILILLFLNTYYVWKNYENLL